MLEGLYHNEMIQMKALLNSKNVLINMSYKLEHDHNVKILFKTMFEKVKNFNELEHMEKYYFKKDMIELHKLLTLFYTALSKDAVIKTKTAEEIAKSCSTFPDYIGKRILKQLAFLPLLNGFIERETYEEYIAKNESSIAFSKTNGDDFKDKLNPDSIMYQVFPDDSCFIDYKQKSDFIDGMKKRYETVKKDEINNSLNLLIDIYEKSENKDETLLMLGMSFWTEKRNIHADQIEAFKNSFKAISEAFKDKNEQLYKSLSSLLKDSFIKNLVANEEDEINISKDPNNNIYIITFKTSKDLSEEELKTICTTYILVDNYDLSSIKFLQKINSEYKFSCSIDI